MRMDLSGAELFLGYMSGRIPVEQVLGHPAYLVVREHAIPALSEVVTPGQWLSYFKPWVQNEAYATYAPLAPRQKNGHLLDA